MTSFRDVDVDESMLGDETPEIDVYGEAPVSAAEAAEAVRRIVEQAARERLPAPPLRVSSGDLVVGDASFTREIVGSPTTTEIEGTGADEDWLTDGDNVSVFGDEPRMFSAPAPKLPLFQRLLQGFSRAMPPARRVRLDDAHSFAEFVMGRQMALEQRVDDLEHALTEHVADGHGGAITTIPLSLPPWMQGKVHCWRAGDEICCSIRLPGPDGAPLIATTGTPAAVHEEEVVGYAESAGVNPVTVLGCMSTIAGALGGGSLVPQLAGAAPSLLARAHREALPIAAEMVPEVDPMLAAATELLRACDAGDAQACREVAAMQRDPAAAAVLAEARQALAPRQAQRRSLWDVIKGLFGR